MTQEFKSSQPDSAVDPLLGGTGYLAHAESADTLRSTEDRIRLQIPSMPLYLHSVRDFVYRLCLLHGLSKPLAFDMKLITGEALTNIMKHAYGSRADGSIFIDLLFFRTYLEIRFRDFGKQSKQKPFGTDVSEYRLSGLGLYLISEIADYHYFDHSNGTLLVVKKRIAA